MADKSDMSYRAGEAAGHTQTKKDEMVDNARNATDQAGGYVRSAGEQIKNVAQGAADAVKKSVGLGDGTAKSSTTKK